MEGPVGLEKMINFRIKKFYVCYISLQTCIPPPGSKHFFCTLKILKIESTSYIRSNCGMGKTLYYRFSHLLSPATTDCFRSIVEHFIN